MKVHEKGSVSMVIVLSSLFLLSSLAITFVVLSSFNRKTVDNYVSKTNAKMAMYAGIDYAISKIQQSFLSDTWYTTLDNTKKDLLLPTWYYGGEDIDGDGICNPGLGEVDIANDGHHCLLSQAITPSFQSDVHGNGDLEGKGFSGSVVNVGETSNFFYLRVTDLSGRIIIDSPIVDQNGNFLFSLRLFDLMVFSFGIYFLRYDVMSAPDSTIL